jgi:hypothetical protein
MPISTPLVHELVKVFSILNVGNHGLVVTIESFDISTQVPGYGLNSDWLLTMFLVV